MWFQGEIGPSGGPQGLGTAGVVGGGIYLLAIASAAALNLTIKSSVGGLIISKKLVYNYEFDASAQTITIGVTIHKKINLITNVTWCNHL